MERYINCYQDKQDMIVERIRVRAYGDLTEAGLHLEKVVSDGFRALAGGR